MSNVQEKLLKILADVLWQKNSGHEYSEQEWEDILSVAEDQGVLFLVLQGCTSIRQQLSAASWMKWRSKFVSTMINNESLLAVQSKIIDLMRNNDIICAVLKGFSLSACYYDPSVRALGDIDLLVPVQFVEQASAILVSQGFHAPKDSFAHSYHIDFYKNSIVVELHYAVSTFPDSPAGREAKQCMESWQEQLQQKQIGNHTFGCLADSQQALSLLLHMERHMTTGCIGLRQLCDWAVFLTSITPEYIAEEILPELKLCGLADFAAVLTWTAVRYLGLDTVYAQAFLTVRECYVQAMIEEILRVGSVHNKNNTEDSSSFFVDESGTEPSMRVFISKINSLARRKFPLTKKLPFLIPLFWFYIPLRYWFRSLMGKRRRKSLLRTIAIIRQRKQLYRALNLFKESEERWGKNMEKPIRILQCVTIMNRNGLENRLMDIYRNIDRSLIQFDFMTNRSEAGEFDAEIEQLGGRVYHMSRIAPRSFFRYIGELRTFFQEHPEYKIVHSHLNTLSTWPLLMAKRAGVPVRIAHSRNASMDRNFKMVYKAFSRLFINGQATDRFACSQSAGIWLFGKKQVEQDTFHVIPNAIQLNRFLYSEDKRRKMRSKLGIQEKELAVVCVARFSRQKNHAFLLSVFSEIQRKNPDSRLYLVGQGELEQEIRDQISKLGLGESVVFLGSRSDVGNILTAMDGFLFPSFYEGFGTVIVEAQCSALPMLASDSIPSETKLCDCVEFASLKEEPGVWAEKFLALIEKSERRDNSALIREKGYDIRQSYAWMQRFYLDKIETLKQR